MPHPYHPHSHSVLGFIAILLLTALPASAEVMGDCGPPAASENPLQKPAETAHQQLQSSEADATIKTEFAARWEALQARHTTLHAQAEHDDQECAQFKVLADQTLADLQACQAQCNQAANDESAYAACQSCVGPVNTALAERETEYRIFTAKIEPYNTRVLDWETDLKQFTKEASAAIPTGFTGKRFYHMYVKSWINGLAITEPTWTARKIKMDVNIEPQEAKAGQTFDYKIYQAFGAEVEFKNGKISRAIFIPGSQQQLANTTFGLRGEVRATRNDISISADKTFVTFEQRIEGHPNLLIKAVDVAAAEAVLQAWGLDLPAINNKIYNLLRLTISADKVTPYGEGSAFPTHYFWIREQGVDRLFQTQPQVQPSEYFH